MTSDVSSEAEIPAEAVKPKKAPPGRSSNRTPVDPNAPVKSVEARMKAITNCGECLKGLHPEDAALAIEALRAAFSRP